MDDDKPTYKNLRHAIGYKDDSERNCPFCGSLYKPKYPSKAAAMASQDVEGREQWISGCCSTACWDKHFPEEE